MTTVIILCFTADWVVLNSDTSSRRLKVRWSLLEFSSGSTLYFSIFVPSIFVNYSVKVLLMKHRGAFLASRSFLKKKN